MQDTALSVSEIADIFRRHPGSQKKIAAKLNVRPAAISSWLHENMSSVRIEAACRALAEELVAGEKEAA